MQLIREELNPPDSTALPDWSKTPVRELDDIKERLADVEESIRHINNYITAEKGDF